MSAHWVSTRCKSFSGNFCNVRSLRILVPNFLTALGLCFLGAQCAPPDPQSKATAEHISTQPSHDRFEASLPDQPTPVKARAMRARLRRLAALTDAGRPGVCRPCADGSARAICRSRCGEQICAVLWIESVLCEAPWLIKNLDRDEPGNLDRCLTISTIISGHPFAEGGGRQGGSPPARSGEINGVWQRRRRGLMIEKSAWPSCFSSLMTAPGMPRLCQRCWKVARNSQPSPPSSACAGQKRSCADMPRPLRR